MKLSAHRFVQLGAAVATLLVLSSGATAQPYPTKPVRLVVGVAAGGSPDIVGRLIGQWLSRRLGQPFVVENRPGAGGNIGTEAVVKAAPDGHTLLLVSLSHAINASLYNKLSFNFIRDIAPVGGISRGVNVMLVNPSFPARTFSEFVTYAKAHPDKISMASAGIGSGPHLTGELLQRMAGIKMVHVPYRGAASALTDLLGGQVEIYFTNPVSALAYIREGKLRALAVTSAERIEVLPGIPAVREFLPGFEASTWLGIGAPRNTPPETIMALNREINASLGDPAIIAQLAASGNEVFAGSPADFSRLIAEETEKWGNLVRAAKLSLE
jgi:tripartite-type tricarboxylate transporter receptor subunit TctC